MILGQSRTVVSPRGKYVPKKRHHIGTCQICGGPIMSVRRDRIPQAKSCSRECHKIWTAKRMRERPPRHYQVEKHIGSQGYAFIRINRLSAEDAALAKAMVTAKAKYIQEHRLAMATHLGRPLLPTETVHHRDNDKTNNDPANLEMWVGKHGSGARAAELRCPHCGKTYA